jgi:hypothetical protein
MALEPVIKEVRGKQRVTDKNPESRYEASPCPRTQEKKPSRSS